MATKASKLKAAFVNETDVEIERATRSNFARINQQNIEEIHRKMIGLLGQNESTKYRDFFAFQALVNEIAESRKMKEAQNGGKNLLAG